MPQAGFEPTFVGSKRPQTHTLDRAATWTGSFNDKNFSSEGALPAINLK